MLPYTPLHHLLLRELGRPDRADQRQRLRRADRLPGRGRPGPAGRHRGRVPHPRPADPHPDRRLGGAPVPRPGGRCCAAPGATCRSRWPGRPLRAAGAGLRRGAEEHVLPGRGDRAFLSHHIGDLENFETLRSFTEGIAHFRRLFDVTPQIVAHDLHPEYLSTKYALEQDGWSWPACSTTTRTSPPAWPTTARRGRSSGSPSTAPATARTPRSGAVSSCSPTWPTRAGRPPGRGADAGRRRRDQAAMADGGRVPRRRLPRRPARRPGHGRAQSGRLADRAGPRPRRGMNAPAHVQCGPAVRRGRRAAGGAGRHQLRGPGRGRARAAGPPSRHDPYRPRSRRPPARRGRRRPGACGGRGPAGRRPRRSSPPGSTTAWPP